jgi:hypothetical protein
MSHYSELKRVLQAQLNWHGARISFLALFLLALLKVKTVNLNELCLGFGGRALAAQATSGCSAFFEDLNSITPNWPLWSLPGSNSTGVGVEPGSHDLEIRPSLI